MVQTRAKDYGKNDPNLPDIQKYPTCLYQRDPSKSRGKKVKSPVPLPLVVSDNEPTNQPRVKSPSESPVVTADVEIPLPAVNPERSSHQSRARTGPGNRPSKESIQQTMRDIRYIYRRLSVNTRDMLRASIRAAKEHRQQYLAAKERMKRRPRVFDHGLFRLADRHSVSPFRLRKSMHLHDARTAVRILDFNRDEPSSSVATPLTNRGIADRHESQDLTSFLLILTCAAVFMWVFWEVNIADRPGPLLRLSNTTTFRY